MDFAGDGGEEVDWRSAESVESRMAVNCVSYEDETYRRICSIRLVEQLCASLVAFWERITRTTYKCHRMIRRSHSALLVVNLSSMAIKCLCLNDLASMQYVDAFRRIYLYRITPH